jgi:hypothetical protein
MNIAVGAALTGSAIPSVSARSEDPVFALIESHKKANAEYYEALKVVPGTSNPDPELEDLFGNREDDARYELTCTTPTTIAGLLALLAYIEGVTDGPCSPNGKPDIAFEQDLMNVVVGARECLQANLGFEAR